MNNPAKKRDHIRSKPDPNDYVEVDLNADSSPFSSKFVALLVEEAPMGGCSFACLLEHGLEVGQVIRVKVGRMAELRAEIVWIRELDDQVTRYGVKYLE